MVFAVRLLLVALLVKIHYVLKHCLFYWFVFSAFVTIRALFSFSQFHFSSKISYL
jgi:hypothetical protein